MTIDELTIARLGHAMPLAETRLDEALEATAQLFATMVRARREADATGPAEQAALTRLAQAQRDLLAVRGELMRVHGQLAAIGEAHGCGGLVKVFAAGESAGTG